MALKKDPAARFARAEEQAVAVGYVATTKAVPNAADGLLAKPSNLLMEL